MSLLWESNPQPHDYKSCALPIELKRQISRTIAGLSAPKRLIKNICAEINLHFLTYIKPIRRF